LNATTKPDQTQIANQMMAVVEAAPLPTEKLSLEAALEALKG
jgi:hypothetical protein